MMRYRSLGPLAAVLLATSACDLTPGLALREPAIPEIPHAGDRRDAPPLAQRGNASFSAASFDDAGKLLVTAPFMGPPGLQVWDAQTGVLLSSVPARSPEYPNRPWMIDSRRQRLLAHKLGEKDLFLFDLRTGRDLAKIPEDGENGRLTLAAGLTGDGNEVLLFKPGWLEVWQLDPPALLRRAKSPLPQERFAPSCVGGIPFTYNDKSCWEWSPDRRALALAYTPVFSPMSQSHFILVDAQTLKIEELTFPTERANRTLASFAFSPDGRKLAVGTDQELLVYDRATNRWGPTIPGDHKRNKYLGAMRFTPDGRRLIALGDQLQVSVYDVETGGRVGRLAALDWDQREAEFRTSRDGSRMVIYHFISDTFEIVDGSEARRLGWVCPYFCNVKHNPVQPPYAVSPDGKSVAVSQRRGVAVWDTETDTLKFALRDPQRAPLTGNY